jgi:chromosome segregation ATPase
VSGKSGLVILEEKITKAADLIAKLRAEKIKAEDANKVLKGKIESLYIKNEELAKKLQDLKKAKDTRSKLDKTREEIKNKIEEMLVKLEKLDF